MTTTIDTHENIQRAPKVANSSFEAYMRRLSGDEEIAGYIVYLTERELFEAYPRAKRENPDALVHFEWHDDDLWSLEVYKSEAAKHSLLVNFYHRQKLLSTLIPLNTAGRASDA